MSESAALQPSAAELEPGQELNELDDDELIECVRQSAFSIELPMPLKSGRVSRQLTLDFGVDEPLPRK